MTPDPLVAGQVRLAVWEVEEAQAYIDLRDDLVFRFTTEDPGLDLETARANIAAARTDPRQVPFAIRDADGAPIGNVAVYRRGRRGVVSYWLSAPARGRGLAAEAVRAVSSWALAELDVDDLELEVDADNDASLAVAAAAGYRRHGMRLESACGGPAVIWRRP